MLLRLATAQHGRMLQAIEVVALIAYKCTRVGLGCTRIAWLHKVIVDGM